MVAADGKLFQLQTLMRPERSEHWLQVQDCFGG